MQEIVANVDLLCFDIERALEQQLGSQPLAFPGMDSKGFFNLMSDIKVDILDFPWHG